MKLKHWILLGVLAVVVAVAGPWLRKGVHEQTDKLTRDLDLGPGRVAVLPITGEIQDSGWTVHWLKRFGNDVRGVKAIVIDMDTPGGGVAPSQEICDEIHSLRDDGIVVVTSMGNVAASGGYYIASASDEIVANPGTITGSIGVIWETWEAQQLLRKLGAGFQVVKSGEFKDTGTFARPFTAREKAQVQTVVDDVYDQFVDAVAQGRHDPMAAVLAKRTGRKAESFTETEIKAYTKRLADGRVYSGRQALDNGLVDSLGSLDFAIDRAAELAGLDDPEVITYREQKSFAELITGMTRTQIKSWVRQTLMGDGPHVDFLLR